MLKKLEPIFIERSFVPKLLSFFAPIEIGAITLGFVVFSRGTVSDSTRRHETIHFQQYLETLFVGFLLLYFYDYCRSRVKGVGGPESYREIRAEKEAYENQDNLNYLENRPRWKWMKART
jgi:hypothetical protein